MILIVGGAVYVGSHANKYLHARGYRTVVFDNLVYGHRSFVKWGDFVLGDLSDKGQIRLCFERYPIEAVMHFSAFAYVGESVTDPAKYYGNDVANTLNLLDVMREFGIRYFIFSSSCATYGMPREIPISEDHPRSPINPYGRSKAMVEDILRDYDRRIYLIPLTVDAALGRQENVKIFGTDYPTNDGTCIRDYVHVTDLADAHLRALQYLQAAQASDSFNLGNGNGYSVREVIDAVRKVSGLDIAVTEAERRAGDPPVLVGSSKAMTTLGWKPQFGDLESIISTAWRWHLGKG
jgi:UDP-glucose 4-epimerase